VVHGSRGFCAVNIEAIMIEFLRAAYKVRRVAIVDTDCHHGDGTQDIYWHDPDTLFISLHQDGRTLYPGTGFTNELGGPNATGMTINIPLPPHTGDEGFLSVMREAVLPILQEFKPELVVNSAGQDNHFSDPITNMNFSAQGYATLTDLLKPDICVLEGGYSIEGALPYVNVGLILALAGVDYSRVREPAYDPDRIRQPAMVTARIAETCKEVLSLWDQRQRLRDRAGEAGDLATRERTVFYDTDNIVERQKETVRVCRDCGGAWKVDSSSDRQKRILAVHIPRHACRACQQAGYDWFEQAPTDGFDRVFLQDRTKDQFRIKGLQPSGA